MLDINKFCSINKIAVKENYDFGLRHGYKVPGKVLYYIHILNVNKLCDFLYFAKNNKVKLTAIGGGSNILINDFYNGVLLKYEAKNISMSKGADSQNPKIVRAEAGASKKDLVNFCIKNECSGLEFWAGIPGKVGGGVAMNAGAYGEDISSMILDIEFASPDGIKKFSSGELDWSYRNLKIPDYYIINAVSFILKSKNSEEIRELCKSNFDDREKKHPLYYNSCGSIFKNPKEAKLGAWKLIKDAGLSACNINGAKISLLHSNFIVTTGSEKTRSKDILELIKVIKDRVYYKHGIVLEEEIRIIF